MGRAWVYYENIIQISKENEPFTREELQKMADMLNVTVVVQGWLDDGFEQVSFVPRATDDKA